MNKYVEFIKDSKNQKHYFKWLINLTKKSRKSLVGLFLLNTGVAVATILVSLVEKNIVDEKSQGSTFQSLVIILVLVQFFSIIGGVIESLLESVIVEKYAIHVREDLFDKLLKLPWVNRNKYHSEELLSRITSDVEQITNGVSRLIISGGGLIIRLVLAYYVLRSYSRGLALLMVVIAPIGALSSMIVGKGMSKIQKEFQQTEADYRVFLQERLSKIELIQIFGQEKDSVNKLNKIQEKRLKLVKQKNHWKVIGAIVISVTFVAAQLFAFVVCTLKVKSGVITFGVMTAFLSLVGQIQGPIYSLANLIPSTVGILASAGRIMEISELDIEKDNEENSELINILNKDITLGLKAQSVSIGYSEEDIIKNLSFDIKPGQMVMLVGSSGIGKTTLLRSIMGFLKPSAGDIYFYTNNDIKLRCGINTRKAISYVPQGNTLVFGSIADNLRMGKSDATIEEMRQALLVADALEFVDGLTDGINTVIGEKATGISEGQAQRISIARALLKKSSILILDEATSSLDEDTELKILDAISKAKYQTCIFVSHRLYLKKYADQVIEL